MRSELMRPTSPGGAADAQRRLCAGMRPARASALWAHVAARTRFFDEQVQVAVAGGIAQIVILGAGYDDRALRFPAPAVRYVEIDHPDTQRDKRGRLQGLGDLRGLDALTLAPADFRTDDVATVLAGHGHDASSPTLFILEGLLVYLDESATVSLLGALHRRAQESSVLAASLAVHAEGLASARVVARANAGRVHAGAEPWRTIATPSAQRHLLARSGWQVAEAVDDAAVDAAAPRGRSLLVTARPA